MTDRKVIYKGLASHTRKAVADGGTLTLFEDELVFKPHFFNLSRELITIPLNKIKAIEIEGLFIFGPNLCITVLGREEMFSVFHPKVWREHIRQQLNKYRDQKNTGTTTIKQITSSDKESRHQLKHKRKLEL